MWARALCLVWTIAACYSSPTDSCAIRCTPGDPNACPGDLTCGGEGYCRGATEVCTTSVKNVTVGGRHACGLDATGRIACWGDAHQGQSGTSATDVVLSPAYVGDASVTWTAVAAGGQHTCGLTGGKVLCWGMNDLGQARGGHGGMVPTPMSVSLPSGITAPNFTALSTGGSHTCAIGEDGTLWCWGKRESLGLGADISFMQQVGTRTDWTAVSGGATHTCGIAGGELLCWGQNEWGQSGQPASGVLIATPTPVNEMLPASKVPLQVAAGYALTCVIVGDAPTDATGELWCWGRNDQHQIDATGVRADHAIQITTMPEWSSVTMGPNTVCGIRGGHASCWGTASAGGLGGGVWNAQLDPTIMVDLGPADAIALGQVPSDNNWDEVGCLRRGAQALCWGENVFGEDGLGIPATEHYAPTPVPSPNGQAWTALWTGHNHTCATTSDASLFCWGSDQFGQISAAIPRGSRTQPCVAGEACDFPRPRPPAPPAVTAPDQVVAGFNYTCARQGATITCWGGQGDGQLGAMVGNPGINTVMAPIGHQWVNLLGGDNATCAMTEAGALLCWGKILDGASLMPAPLNDPGAVLGTVTDIDFADQFACAVRSDQARVCWGRDDIAELGDGALVTTTTPAVVSGTVTQISAKGSHSCAVTQPGGVICWGGNDQLQSATTPNTPVSNPATVKGTSGDLQGCTDVSASQQFACAICGGQTSCWGIDWGFQLGRGYGPTASDANAAPVASTGLTFAHVAAGATHACAIDTAGALLCWGYGLHGELGDGSHGVSLPTLIAPSH